MTTAALITLFFGVIIVMTALRLSKRKEKATPHEENDNDIFRRAPRWAGRLHEQLNELKQQVGREARADERRDTKMSAATQTAINELKAEIEPMTNAMQALSTAWDAFLDGIEESKDDPAEIMEITTAYRAQKEQILAMALKGTPIDPSGN